MMRKTRISIETILTLLVLVGVALICQPTGEIATELAIMTGLVVLIELFWLGVLH